MRSQKSQENENPAEKQYRIKYLQNKVSTYLCKSDDIQDFILNPFLKPVFKK